VSDLTPFLQQLAASCAQDQFVRLTLSSPAPAAAPVERVIVRLVELRGERQLSFTFREARRDTTRNLAIADAGDEVARLLAGSFRGALLATTVADWQLRRDDDGAVRLIRHRPSAREVPARGHDERKPTWLGEAARPWLTGLGILDDAGRPRRYLADKHTQIGRYVEVLAHLARDCGFDRGGADAAPLRIVDVGCGKGHLTFAAWHLCRHVLGRRADVVGVEAREDLVTAANALAERFAPGELRFQRGDIGDAPLHDADVVVALHACNTATDHAIRRGVQLGARLVVVAPCCHQEVRPQLAAPPVLAAALQHGLLADRMAEWATDALRAQVLEWAGYRTKVIEFVGGEHTPKNLMLAAVRSEAPADPAARAEAKRALEAFRAFFGIGTHALDPLLAAP
jgi:SAM-dependent methyltransferase